VQGAGFTFLTRMRTRASREPDKDSAP
jgi:hypothetical protein